MLPQVTVISVSGSTCRPRCQPACSATASRRLFEPQVIAYWLTSVFDRATGGLFDLARRREIGHSLRQIDCAVLARLDRHAPDHALGEPRRLVRDQGQLHRLRCLGGETAHFDLWLWWHGMHDVVIFLSASREPFKSSFSADSSRLLAAAAKA